MSGESSMTFFFNHLHQKAMFCWGVLVSLMSFPTGRVEGDEMIKLIVLGVVGWGRLMSLKPQQEVLRC